MGQFQILTGIGILLYFVNVAKQKAESFVNKLNFGNPQLSFERFTSDAVFFKAVLPIQNANNLDIYIDSITGHIEAGANKLASFRSLEDIVIRANTESLIELKFNVLYDDIGLIGAEAWNNWELPENLTLIGTVYVQQIAIPIKRTII